MHLSSKRLLTSEKDKKGFMFYGSPSQLGKNILIFCPSVSPLITDRSHLMALS